MRYKKTNRNTCMECGKVLSEYEMRNHPYVHCLMAKAFPTTWRKRIKEIVEFYNEYQD